MKPPIDIKELRGLLGMCSYYRKYIPNYSKIMSPLIELTKKNADVLWND